MRKIAVVLVLALAAPFALGNVALAEPADTDTTFRMRDEGSFVVYKGRVSSDRDRCERGREVEIYHDGVLIGKTTTDEDGRWNTQGPVPPDGDKVTAKVLPKTNRAGEVVCEGTKNTKTFVADD